MPQERPPVAIIMGSQSDWPTMKDAAAILDELGVAYETRIVSAHRTPDRLWDFFDGSRAAFNIAHECITRHADGSGRAAVRIAHADGRDEILSFDAIAADDAGERVAVEPPLEP